MKLDRNQLMLFALLVTLGVTLRLGLQEIPNFAPVAAIALFAGYAFRSRWLAVAAPLCIMAASDWVIGGYDWFMMAVVYGMLTAPVFARGLLRRHCRLDDPSWTAGLRSLLMLVASALGGSVMFFLTTNLAVFLRWYERSWQGLAECYLLALPFFRFTLAGDATFAVVLFSAYALATRLSAEREPAELLTAGE